VVGVDGASAVSFAIAAGNYHVAVLHRNHFGCMTAVPVALSVTPGPIDLSSAATSTYGIDARKSITGAFSIMALWAGDVNRDGTMKYTGPANDRDPLLVAVGGSLPTSTAAGYLGSDVNLDGLVKYTGGANDRDPILLNLGGTAPTATRVEQLP
jgi:hypothetical protein